MNAQKYTQKSLEAIQAAQSLALQHQNQQIEQVHQRGHLPVLVGGTGLYISSLVDNIQFSQEDGDPQLREQLKGFAEQNGVQALWQ